MTVNKRGLLTGFKWFSLWLIASVALTALVIEVVDPRYLFNDDMVIAAVASGDYTGTPDPHTVVTGPLFSAFLSQSFALEILPSTDLLLAALEFLLIAPPLLALFLFLRSRHRARHTARQSQQWILGLMTLFLSLYAILWFSTPTFSAVMFAPGFIAMVLALYWFPGDQSKPSLPFLAVVGLLVGATILIRAGLFPLIAFICATLGFWTFLGQRIRKKMAVIGAFAIVPFVLDVVLEAALYRSQRWRETGEILSLLGPIVNSYLIGSLSPIGLNLGWRPYEVGFIASFNFVPTDALSSSSLQSFLDAANPYLFGEWAITPPSLNVLGDVLRSTQTGLILVLLGFLLSLGLMYASSVLVSKNLLVLTISTLTSLSLVLFLGFIRTHPSHVALIVGFASAMAAIGSVGILGAEVSQSSGRKRSRKEVLLGGFLVVVPALSLVLSIAVLGSPLSVGQSWDIRAQKENSWDINAQVYSALSRACPVVGVNLGIEAAPLRRPGPMGELPVLQLGWNSLTPLTDERLKLLGFEKWDDLFAEGACTYFMGGGDYANAMTEYARDRGGVGEFVRVEVPVEGAPEIYQWQNP